MPLPHSFQFSQGSLQAYVDCPRLFQLRYIEGLSWPAPEVEPALENERHLQLGSDFHRLVQQYLPKMGRCLNGGTILRTLVLIYLATRTFKRSRFLLLLAGTGWSRNMI